MKSIIALFACLATHATHADAYCVINGENPDQPNTYDQFIYQGDLSPTNPVAIRQNKSVISGEDVQSEIIKLFSSTATNNGEELKKVREDLNDATFIIGMTQEDQSFSIGIGHFDFSKPEGALVTDVVASASLTKPLLLIESRLHVSISCVQKPAEPAHP